MFRLVKKLEYLIAFTQVVTIENRIDNIIDSFSEKFNAKFFVIVKTSRVVRRREQRTRTKIDKIARRLNIVKSIYIEIIINSYIITVLLDSSNKINFIFINLVKKLKFLFEHKKFIVIFILSGKRLNTHDIYFLNFQIVNNKNYKRYFEKFFLVIDINYKTIILNIL